MKISYNEKQLEILIGLGLNKIQAILYLTSLQHGVLSVLELSKLTHTSRQQIYDEAEKLVALGLYDLTRKQGRKYIPANPEKLMMVGKKQMSETEKILTKLSEMLPQFEKLPAPKKNKVLIKYFDGLPKIREAYEEELRIAKNTEVLSFAGSIDTIFEFFSESYCGTRGIKIL